MQENKFRIPTKRKDKDSSNKKFLNQSEITRISTQIKTFNGSQDSKYKQFVQNDKLNKQKSFETNKYVIKLFSKDKSDTNANKGKKIIKIQRQTLDVQKFLSNSKSKNVSVYTSNNQSPSKIRSNKKGLKLSKDLFNQLERQEQPFNKKDLIRQGQKQLELINQTNFVTPVKQKKTTDKKNTVQTTEIRQKPTDKQKSSKKIHKQSQLIKSPIPRNSSYASHYFKIILRNKDCVTNFQKLNNNPSVSPDSVNLQKISLYQFSLLLKSQKLIQDIVSDRQKVNKIWQELFGVMAFRENKLGHQIQICNCINVGFAFGFFLAVCGVSVGDNKHKSDSKSRTKLSYLKNTKITNQASHHNLSKQIEEFKNIYQMHNQTIYSLQQIQVIKNVYHHFYNKREKFITNKLAYPKKYVLCMQNQ